MISETEELRCPKCLGDLDGSTNGKTCRNCGAAFPSRDGIIDFRSGRHDYYFNPVPPEQMAQLTDGMTRETWPKSIRTFIRGARLNVSWLDNLVVDGRYAWKLFLNLDKETTLLDLGCGLGNLTHNLAPLVRRTYALDLTYARLQFSRKRFSIFNAEDDIVTLAAGDGAHLPFRDQLFDCVVLSGVLEWIGEGDSTPFVQGSKLGRLFRMLAHQFGERNPRQIQLRFLREIRRIIKPSGQLFIAIENRLNHEYFTGRPDHHSMLKYGSLLPRFAANLYSIAVNRAPYRTYTSSILGYRRLLKDAGFPHTEFLGLSRGYSQLEEILPADVSNEDWQPETPTSTRERIKRNKYFVPAYGIISSAAPKPWPQIQDAVFGRIERDLSKDRSARLLKHSYMISGKQKLIMRASLGDRNMVIRIPFNAAARAAESNNAALQNELRTDASLAHFIPMPLSSGEARGLWYWAEEFLPGIPIGKTIRQRGRSWAIPQIERLLEIISSIGGGARVLPLTDSLYDTLVTRRLDTVLSVVDDPQLRVATARFFHGKLHGANAAIGVFHGDFSASNVLVQGDNVTGLIDWEAGSSEGLPILDALGYLMSIQLRYSRVQRLPQVVPLLASGHWPDATEWSFLERRYSKLGMDLSSHSGWAYLAWLHSIAHHLSNIMRYDPVAIERDVNSVLTTMIAG